MTPIPLYSVPPLFNEILKRSLTIDLDIQKHSRQEIQKTFDLCKYIIDIFDSTVVNTKQVSDAYKKIIEQNHNTVGFMQCSFAIHLLNYLNVQDTEIDNDYLKGIAEKDVLDDLLYMRYFIQRMEAEQNGTI